MKWSPNRDYISAEELSSRMFGFLDRDQNNELDSIEQRSMRAFYYFGDQIPSDWDDNANERIEIYELLQHGSDRIAQSFDADLNDRISSLEMSRAMFNRADDNNDMKITSLEFYHWLIYR